LFTPLVPEEMCTSRSRTQPRLRAESQDLGCDAAEPGQVRGRSDLWPAVSRVGVTQATDVRALCE
jgi:hypothetical protein